jgi:hypothetical protein
VKQTNPYGQKREREAANQFPHTATEETTGAHRRSLATTIAMRSRQSARGLGLGLGTGEERGAQPNWAKLA